MKIFKIFRGWVLIWSLDAPWCYCIALADICRPVCIDSRGWRSFFILLHLYSGLGASHSNGNFPYNLSLGRIISHKVTTITVGPFRNWIYFGWNLKIASWNFQWNATTRVVRLKFSAASSKTWTTNSGRQISLPSSFSSSNFYYEIIYDELFGGFSTKT